tara:strand:+ start:10746 stop:11108 length:363 start_codon:yes stop_codon:yes gene_type:complete
MNELTDLEICKRIAEIEGLEWFELDNSKHSKNPYAHAIYLNKSENGTYKNRFNPITDDALILKLIIKHKVDIVHGKSISTVRIYDDPEDNPLSSVDYYHDDTTINKPACLAIIEAHKDQS